MLVYWNEPTPDLHFRYGMPSFRSCLHWVVRLDRRGWKSKIRRHPLPLALLMGPSRSPTNALRRYHICRIVGPWNVQRSFISSLAQLSFCRRGVPLPRARVSIGAPARQTLRRRASENRLMSLIRGWLKESPIANNHTTLGETSVRKRRHLRSSEMTWNKPEAARVLRNSIHVVSMLCERPIAQGRRERG